MKGLIVGIYGCRDSHRPDPLSVMRGKNYVVVVGDGIPEMFEASEDAPAVVVVHKEIDGKKYIHAEPENKYRVQPWYAFGGTFIFSSDSRFRELINDYPVPLHDRVGP